ncbi:hypothetical protein GCM10023089_30880 [Quisquiliibacterium transsilvanicum]
MASAFAGVLVALVVSALAPSASPTVLALAAGVSAALALALAMAEVLRQRRRLADGGIAVARLLGARAVVPDPIDPAERRLCDVAREIAIAAGTQVPMLCLLDADTSINACAAGRTPGDAVVIFTRGAVEQMSREELQGVFAHVLAHILHGDVRPAFALGEFAGGLRSAYDAGLVLLRTPAGAARAQGPARRRRARQGLLRAVGLLLAGAGSLGMLAALSMQAGAARRRALRADATAIRITRVPEALASALRKAQRPAPAAARFAPPAAGGATGADAATMRALTAHGWFVSPERRARPFVTHPPIPERIRRIAGRSLLANAPMHSGPVSDRWPLRWHVAAAAVRRPAEARAVALALLAPGRAAELRLPGARDVFAIAPDTLPSAARQALLELAAATLRNEPPQARTELLREARRLVEADARVTLLEFVFYLTMVDRIGEGSGIARARIGAVARLRARRLRDWAGQGLVRWRRTQGGAGEPVDASAALALLIRAALDWHRSRLPRSLRSLTRAFERASAYWGWSLWSPPGALDARELIAAIRVIALLQTLDQARAVKALAAALLGDRNTHPDARAAQAAVLRALCFAWGVPLPPSRGRVSKRESGDAFAGTPTLVYLDA